jgi:hypothetical protein
MQQPRVEREGERRLERDIGCFFGCYFCAISQALWLSCVWCVFVVGCHALVQDCCVWMQGLVVLCLNPAHVVASPLTSCSSGLQDLSVTHLICFRPCNAQD